MSEIIREIEGVQVESAWGIRWLRSALSRDLTPLESKIAEWAHLCYRGIYHLDECRGWQRWMRRPSDYTHEVRTITNVGSPGFGCAWGDLAGWLRVAEETGLKFQIRPGGPHGLCIRFWHEESRPAGETTT